MMRIAVINIDMMTIATVMTVGARWQYPRMQEHHKGMGCTGEFSRMKAKKVLVPRTQEKSK